jgi:hypothetical protein
LKVTLQHPGRRKKNFAWPNLAVVTSLLNKVIVDLDVFADALEGEELGESSSEKVMAKMKAHFLTSWARLRGRDQCIKRS